MNAKIDQILDDLQQISHDLGDALIKKDIAKILEEGTKWQNKNNELDLESWMAVLKSTTGEDDPTHPKNKDIQSVKIGSMTFHKPAILK